MNSPGACYTLTGIDYPKYVYVGNVPNSARYDTASSVPQHVFKAKPTIPVEPTRPPQVTPCAVEDDGCAVTPQQKDGRRVAAPDPAHRLVFVVQVGLIILIPFGLVGVPNPGVCSGSRLLGERGVRGCHPIHTLEGAWPGWQAIRRAPPGGGGEGVETRSSVVKGFSASQTKNYSHPWIPQRMDRSRVAKQRFGKLSD